MASKKLLKKRVKRIVYEVLDSCDYHIVNGHSSADNADKLIDEAVDFHENIIGRINGSNEKKELRQIASEVDKASADFTDKLNGLN
ncbi:hypothetical protein N9Y60_05815 [Crocinitomicaceae bacterium]|nr:hypothetical protein [Crocinitomicaceae bacterium]MDB3907451.1 hypothetical protein [Crocinitomicaceae bacterium]